MADPVFTPARPRRPHLLYLPGMDGTGDLFYRQAARLQQLFEIQSISLNPAPSHSWSELAAYVQQQSRAEQAFLCGESFGACLALQVACDYPHLCQGLILVNPASSYHRGPWYFRAGGLLPWIPEPLYLAMAERGLPLLAALERMDPSDREALATAVRSVPPTTSAQRLNLLSRFHVDLLPLGQLDVPTILVAGGRDRLLPSIEEVERLAGWLPRAHIEVSPESGHACLLERDLDLHKILLRHPLLPSSVFSRT
jgi:pimeloyl-ACP methyl ester carboxylesterase